MNRRILFVLSVLILSGATGSRFSVTSSAEAGIPEGFTPLFNGKDLSGWKGLVGNPRTRARMSADELKAAQQAADRKMREHWKVVNGELMFDGKGDNLCTERDYRDFELYLEWKIPKGGDSGIYLRGCPQVQLWDTDDPNLFRHGAENGSGGLWNNRSHPRFPLTKADHPAGQWNTMLIRMIGERVSVWLNEQLVVDGTILENLWEPDRPVYASGQIELQNHGNTLWFRNIGIREIGPEQANAILSGDQDRDEQGTTLFNGQDLAGWTGAVNSYEVRNGALICRSGQSGTLYTQDEYTDFTAQMEFRLPSGGNNGLAIRYPGQGNPHHTGMCEIQILDDDHEKYANLDPRQYHGSVYGLVAAHRGFLRPPGEWNFQQVTVRGSRIRVELNGTTILDADVSDVSESKDGAVYPGVRVKKGHFGFAGHGDPVAFRRIRIRELPGEPAQPPPRESARTPKNDPVRLFNGKNLEGFYTWIRGQNYTDSDQVFTVKDGLIHVSGNGYGGLITRDAWRDYHLIVEFRWGKKTWGNRTDRARDSGILLHCWGPDGGYADTWMASIEAQIIEGGVGDILVLSGTDPITGQRFPTQLTAEITKDRDGERVWKKGGKKVTITGGRINWFGRDPDWKDVVGFRGREDVESPFGDWTRLEVTADGDHLVYRVNGVVVNEAFDARPDAGKILLQTEQAELFVRRFELWPLDSIPEEQHRD